MLTLHGFPYSNYHNIVKHALMQKGIDFEEHIAYPGSPELLAVNPAGKVPAMTTEHGTVLSESSVLVEYLEDAYPEHPLLPADPEARGEVRRLIKIAELYLELPGRRLLPAVFGNVEIPTETLAEVRADLERGVAAYTNLAVFSPYVNGAELTLADIYLRYALAIPQLVGPSHLDWDVVAAIPGMSEWYSMISDSDIARKIDADQQANTEEFMAFLGRAVKG